jgi:hypothetical protein
MKLFPILSAIAITTTAANIAPVRAGEITPSVMATSSSQGSQNIVVTNRQATDRPDINELSRLLATQNTRLRGYVFNQRLIKALGSELVDAVEKKQFVRARLLGMQLAPKFGYKDYKLFLAEITSNQFPTTANVSSLTTLIPQTVLLWDVPIDRQQTQKVATSK